MKYSKLVVPVWALSKKSALAKARNTASDHFRGVIMKIQKSGYNLEAAQIAPVMIERNWFKYWVHYETTIKLGSTTKPAKKEPNCKVKKVKKVAAKKAKAKKKVYKK